MRRKQRYTAEQILQWLRDHARGVPVSALCQTHGFADTSFYRWKARFGDPALLASANEAVGAAREVEPLLAA